RVSVHMRISKRAESLLPSRKERSVMYMKTLYEQLKPVGDNAHGTHYSVMRARLWHNPNGSRSGTALDHTFAVIWDEDHDGRVLLAIEELHVSGTLANVKFIGEIRGVLQIIPIINGDKFPQYMSIDGDSWSLSVSDRLANAGPEYLAGIESI